MTSPLLILSGSCTACSLHKTRRKIVWGEGPVPCRIMFIGEGPGSQEDRTGRPFFFRAKAGQEFNHILKRHDMAREDVFVTNMVKCHCPNDADPTDEQISACLVWLELEIEAVQPEIIVPMGRFATRYFLGDVDMEQVHGFPYIINR
jgi:DNA polymerase